MYAFEVAERLPDPEQRRVWLTFVIVGAGPTGVELAGAIAEIARQTLKNDFRHTVATSMLRAGHGVKVVSELLGHADVAITLRTYDHVESDAFRVPLNEAASQLL